MGLHRSGMEYAHGDILRGNVNASSRESAPHFRGTGRIPLGPIPTVILVGWV